MLTAALHTTVHTARLAAFGGIDAVKSDARSMDVNRVAVDNPRGPDDVAAGAATVIRAVLKGAIKENGRTDKRQ